MWVLPGPEDESLTREERFKSATLLHSHPKAREWSRPFRAEITVQYFIVVSLRRGWTRSLVNVKVLVSA